MKDASSYKEMSNVRMEYIHIVFLYMNKPLSKSTINSIWSPSFYTYNLNTFNGHSHSSY